MSVAFDGILAWVQSSAKEFLRIEALRESEISQSLTESQLRLKQCEMLYVDERTLEVMRKDVISMREERDAEEQRLRSLQNLAVKKIEDMKLSIQNIFESSSCVAAYDRELVEEFASTVGEPPEILLTLTQEQVIGRLKGHLNKLREMRADTKMFVEKRVADFLYSADSEALKLMDSLHLEIANDDVRLSEVLFALRQNHEVDEKVIDFVLNSEDKETLSSEFNRISQDAEWEKLKELRTAWKDWSYQE